jgi:hypothetical protein
MKISEYVAQLTASGVTEEVARGLAKGQASALSLVDDVGLTKPLASGLVKGLVAGGMDEDGAVDVARVAIAKGNAVDDLKSEPATAPDAIAELEAASDALIKGYCEPAAKGKDTAKDDEGQVSMDLGKGDDDDDDDDEDDEDLDGDGDPNTMPARKGRDIAKIATLMKGAVDATSANLEKQFGRLSDEIAALRRDNDALRSQVTGIAKGIGAQGNAFVALAKGIAQPRPPKSVSGLEAIAHPSEQSPIQTVDYDYRAGIASAALAKGQRNRDPKEAAELQAFFDAANDLTKSDDAIRAAAAKLGL